MRPSSSSPLYRRIREILEAARAGAVRSVNTAQVVSNWLIGREIVEEEQKGKRRAGYGENLLLALSKKLPTEFGGGYSVHSLKFIRQFYVEYPRLTDGAVIGYALRSQSEASAAPTKREIRYAVRSKSWTPGRLHPNLSWTHYRTLLRVDRTHARSFYEIEAIKNHWSARELERQINSLLHERLALSRDKRGLMRLAVKGHEVQKPADVFKDPTVMEFLGLPESPKLVETNLEQAMIDNLQSFLLELGKGFAFVSRQERLTLDGGHFYICADKNSAVVRYTLGRDQRKTIFASRYKLHLPSTAELRAELRREVKSLATPLTRGGTNERMKNPQEVT